ncbi:MAG: glycosyltransferase [Actinomycetota bacterium]|nr:MAG: glycoside hydrolase family [Actinomycetota bacterium]MDO8950816.1 glycosyltransferase [Actinomycetota bacterium]MDP3629928.1 glycosyltransferase [Actinomycetota bacterium]
MRVLVIPSWYPGPDAPTAGVFIEQQVRALSSVANVAVLHVEPGRAAFGPTVTDEDGVTVIRSGIVASNLFARYFGYRRTGLAAMNVVRVRWGMPDIVHVQALWPAALIARDISRRFGIPYVITEHSEEYLEQSSRRLIRTPGMLQLVLRPLARSASRIIAVSRFLADRLRSLGLASDPIVIPNVVPDSPATPLPMAAPHLISHVSIMGPAKNLDALLQAIAKLKSARSDFVLRLAGDGECRTQLERLSAELDLGDVVQFLGIRDAAGVLALIAESAFTVISSSHETFSVVAAESLMSGRPVLSTRCGGPEEFITPEVGRLVDADSTDALAEGLGWMLDHYTEFEPTSLHEYARERFAPAGVACQALDVYRSVLDA